MSRPAPRHDPGGLRLCRSPRRPAGALLVGFVRDRQGNHPFWSPSDIGEEAGWFPVNTGSDAWLRESGEALD